MPDLEPEMWMGRRREDRYAGHKDLLSAKEPGVAIEHVSSDVALGGNPRPKRCARSTMMMKGGSVDMTGYL